MGPVEKEEFEIKKINAKVVEGKMKILNILLMLYNLQRYIREVQNGKSLVQKTGTLQPSNPSHNTTPIAFVFPFCVWWQEFLLRNVS